MENLNKNPKLFVVVPCYNEEEVIAQSFEILHKKLSCMIERQIIAQDSALVFVDDGSKDKTWQILKNLTHSCPPPILRPKIIALRLSRNQGHQNALLAGLEYAKHRCDCAISIDCDLQDDINTLEEFVYKFQSGAEVVYGVRKARDKDSFFKRNSALGFYKLMSILGVKIVSNHADYRLLSARAISALLEFKEANLFLRGIVPLLGFKSDKVYYDRLKRELGDSKYPLRKMLSFAWNGITSFSIVPLRMVSVLGVVFFLLSLCLGLYAMYVKLFTSDVVYGWASTIILFSFFSGIQLLSLGVIGEYIGKIYIESKKRPRYFLQECIEG